MPKWGVLISRFSHKFDCSISRFLSGWGVVIADDPFESVYTHIKWQGRTPVL